MSPSLVLITATSFRVFTGFSSFFSSAPNIAELNSMATKIDNLMQTCGTKPLHCHVLPEEFKSAFVCRVFGISMTVSSAIQRLNTLRLWAVVFLQAAHLK